MYYRDHQDFEGIKKQYNAERVADEINRSEIHKFEIAKNLNDYIKACQEQIAVIKATKIKKYVYLKRGHDYRTNHVKYEVGVMNYPDIENGSRYQWVEKGTGQVFGGREKKQAKEYADQLAAEYRCEIRQ